MSWDWTVILPQMKPVTHDAFVSLKQLKLMQLHCLFTLNIILNDVLYVPLTARRKFSFARRLLCQTD